MKSAYFWFTEVDDASLAALIAAAPRLRALNLAGSKADDETVALITEIALLDYLGLNSCRRITDDGFALLTNTPSLNSLELASTRLSRDGLESLAGHLDLQLLKLCGTRLTDHNLSVLQQFPNVKSLDLDADQFTEEGVKYLQELPNFSELGFSGGAIELKHFAMLPRLKALSLYGGPFDADDMKYVADLPNLEVLRIGSPSVSDAHLNHLHQLKSIKRIEVTDCPNATREAVERLQAALPNCAIVSQFVVGKASD